AAAFLRDRFGERNDAGFGGCIRCRATHPAQRRGIERSHVHDAPFAAHPAQRRAAAEKTRPQIDVHHLLEQLERGLRERRSHPASGAVHGSPDDSILLQGALERPLVGDLLLLVGVIAWAVYTAEGREVVGRLGAFPTIAWTLITGTVLYLPLGLGALLVPSYRADIVRASTAAWWGVAYLILMTSV